MIKLFANCVKLPLVKVPLQQKRKTHQIFGAISKSNKEEYKKASSQKLSSKRTHDQMNQRNLVELFDNVKKWKADDSRAKAIDKLIVEMIATDNLPFTVVQNTGFQRLVSKLEPRYKIKSEKFYRTELFPTTYEDVRQKIKQLLSEDHAGDSISFTTDCWSGTTESMMSLTAHFIDKNWKRNDVVLNVKSYGRLTHW